MTRLQLQIKISKRLKAILGAQGVRLLCIQEQYDPQPGDLLAIGPQPFRLALRLDTVPDADLQAGVFDAEPDEEFDVAIADGDEKPPQLHPGLGQVIPVQHEPPEIDCDQVYSYIGERYIIMAIEGQGTDREWITIRARKQQPAGGEDSGEED